MTDGGVCGRYHLRRGWTSSYPETTGYTVSTFLALARSLDDPSFERRAQRCVEFLLSVQLPSGAFPAGEVHENQTAPSVFNTAQVLSGLSCWYAWSADPDVLRSAHRAAAWLVRTQEIDGAWRQHTYMGVPAVYSAYASCWLAEFATIADHAPYRDAPARHLDWVLGQVEPNGWLDLAGFDAADHRARRALTHTIGYALWGTLRTSELLEREEGIHAVETAARAIAAALAETGALAGVLDDRWRGASTYACPTGSAQLALVWLRLYERDGSSTYLNSAESVLEGVKAAQIMGVHAPDLDGGVPGSTPVWGAYLRWSLPSWAAKFLVDALLEKQRAIAEPVPVAACR